MKSILVVIQYLFLSILLVSNSLVFAQGHESAQKVQPQNSEQLSAVDQALNRMNDGFRKLYVEQTKAVMKDVPLILIVSGDGVTALSGQTRTIYPLPKVSNEIKASLHSVLGFQGLMVKLSGTTDSTEWQKAKSLSKDLGELLSLIPQTDANSNIKQSTIEVVTQLKNATDTFIKQKKVSEEDIKTVLAKVRPSILLAAKGIGQEFAQSLKSLLISIQSKTSKSDWEKTIAVIPGPITARLNNLNAAVTASVMGPELLGKRIFYSENVFDEAGILSYVEILMRDKNLSIMVFGDPYRMWRDLLADTSETIIDTDFFIPLAK